MLVIDLTLRLADGDVPFVDASGFSDPPTRVEPWVRIGEQRGAWQSPFRVSHLHLSAHAGTHIDAPSHFHEGAATVSDLPPESLVGRALVVDLRDVANQAGGLREVRERASGPDVTPLLLTPPKWLTVEAIDEVIAWGRPLIAFAGEEDSDEGLVAVRRLLGAGRWMVSNLDPANATQVQDGDLLIVAPLAIDGLEGSPCRILAIRIP
jgi:arylformamidase